MFQKSQISQVLKQENHGQPSRVSVISNSKQYYLGHYPDICVDVALVRGVRPDKKGSGFLWRKYGGLARVANLLNSLPGTSLETSFLLLYKSHVQFPKINKLFTSPSVQVILCQKHSFLHQLQVTKFKKYKS